MTSVDQQHSEEKSPGSEPPVFVICSRRGVLVLGIWRGYLTYLFKSVNCYFIFDLNFMFFITGVWHQRPRVAADPPETR